MKSLIARQALRFGGVGGIGFITDATVFGTMLTLGVNPFLARALAFAPAVLVTWWLNRTWTFSGASKTKPRQQLNRYALVQLIGAGVNFAMYSAWLGLFGTAPLAAFMAFAAGAGAGMVINFWASRKFAFV
jgi:putative flippase GtrA